MIRRAIRHLKELGIANNVTTDIAKVVINDYGEFYPELKANSDIILNKLNIEEKIFSKALQQGIKEYKKVTNSINNNLISGDIAFKLFETYGFPLELTIEMASEDGFNVDVDGFEKCFKQHQEKSRGISEKKFKGGLSSTGEIETKYHTATHLLNAALKKVLGEHVHQKGSNITPERLRFDFSHPVKMTDEEKQKVENLVNKWINEGYKVKCQEMHKDEAIESGAECMFIEKYPDTVTVYTIGDFSKELCGGPHVKNTSELGHFKIKKEEASSSGIRRIKAILE